MLIVCFVPGLQVDTEKRARPHSLCSHRAEYLVEEMQEAFRASGREIEFEYGKQSSEKEGGQSRGDHA